MSLEFNNADLHSSLSKQFLDGVLNNQDWLEAKEDIKLPFADITSYEWCFDGVRIGHANWLFKNSSPVNYQLDVKNEVVTLYFNLKGKTKTSHIGKNGKETFELDNYQHNLFYSPGSAGSFESEEKRLTTFMIQFSLGSFLKLTQDANDVLKKFADNVLEKKPVALSPHNLYLNGEMHNAINAIINCKYQQGLKRMLFYSKSIELLVMQAEAYNVIQRPATSFIKTNYDRERILYAREYLMENLASPPTLSELSKVCGINEYKLKRGFKEVFGNTVFGYLSDLRLEMARTDFLEKKLPASEIALALGYSSLQHFSAAFKKKFGVPPSQLKK
ncbi:MAG: AraC family transcriptional regulator [Cytophagia bacterium]|nr:AraC family transcriptional regulator [Cytophagia bacterium]